MEKDRKIIRIYLFLGVLLIAESIYLVWVAYNDYSKFRYLWVIAGGIFFTGGVSFLRRLNQMKKNQNEQRTDKK